MVAATALVVRRIGARVADEWAGAWGGIGYAVFVHAYLPGDTLGGQQRDFRVSPSGDERSRIPAAVEKRPAWGWMFLSGALCGAATLIRQPSARERGRDAGMSRLCLANSPHSLIRKRRASRQRHRGRIRRSVIGGLALYYQSQGNLHDAYLWAWAFAIRYVESETTLLYVLQRLATVHLSVILSWGLLWYFGIRQVIVILEILATTRTVSTPAVLLVLWLGGRLSDNLYWMAVSRALSSDGASAAVDSRGPGVLALCCETAAFSPAALAMGREWASSARPPCRR